MTPYEQLGLFNYSEDMIRNKYMLFSLAGSEKGREAMLK